VVAASQAMKLPLNETGHFLTLMELSLLGFINFERNKLPSFFFLQKVGFFSDFLSQSFGTVKQTLVLRINPLHPGWYDPVCTGRQLLLAANRQTV